MTVRPILFSGPMIRALLDGSKTQTRRALKPQPIPECVGHEKVFAKPPFFEARNAAGVPLYAYPYPKGCVSPYPRLSYAPGDLLWVREAFAYVGSMDPGYLVYCATYPDDLPPGVENVPDDIRSADYLWTPSIHMPRWASRLTLEVTDVRVQRVQDISEEDARAEGFPHSLDAVEFAHLRGQGVTHLTKVPCRTWFYELWNSLNAKRGFGWEANPWVVALTFKVHRCNVDSFKDKAA